MVDPVVFERWVADNFPDGAELNSSATSRRWQAVMTKAVMEPVVTIISRAISDTGIDEVQARMTVALLYAFEQESWRQPE